MDATLARSLVAEAIRTFTPVFAGYGAIMVMIYAVGHISGAHFNPAGATLGLALRTGQPVQEAA